MNQQNIIICETTYHGNTMKIANAMAKRLECKIIGFDEALDKDLSIYKIIGLGSGIYFKMHHPKLLEIAQKLNSQQKVFIFSTHGSPFLGKYHEPLKEVLKKNHVKVQGEFDCKGYDNTGPFIIFKGGNKGRPHENDMNLADQFVKKLFPYHVYAEHEIPDKEHVFIHSDCIGCKTCVDVCPMQVFKVENGHVIVANQLDCTHCSLCRDHCPKHAISIFHTKKEAIKIAFRHKDKIGLTVKNDN